jgi:hypothetical protein
MSRGSRRAALAEGGEVISARPIESEKVTGLPQKLQVGPIFGLQIPISGLKLAPLLGQPCDFYALYIPFGILLTIRNSPYRTNRVA